MTTRSWGKNRSASNIDSEFFEEVRALHAKLGISEDYQEVSGLPLCRPSAELVATELDFFDRPQQLAPAAFEAWTKMKESAQGQGIQLVLISAYRSLDYQTALIEKKLAKGISLEQILAVNAAPGYSEHHTGRALDLGTPGCAPLEEEFENTEAFQWLASNASRFCFTLSYPRCSTTAICYEPWHWCFQE